MKIGDEGRAMAMKDGFMCGEITKFCIKGHVYRFIKEDLDSWNVCDQIDENNDDPNYNHSMRGEFFRRHFEIVTSLEGTII